MIGLLRVKNEARWIRESIESLRPLCSEVHVFDDHSDDETPDICRSLGATVYESPFSTLDEARDKNFLLEQVAPLRPDWILMIDGDEALAPGAAEQIRVGLRASARAYSLRVLYLWDRPDQVRVDGVYGRFRRPSLFRFGPPRFTPTGAGGNFHCGNAPHTLAMMARPSDAALLHYGYLHREDRLRKYEWYNRQDPRNHAEDGYRHMVIGDLFPAASQFRHAGPLELRQL